MSLLQRLVRRVPAVTPSATLLALDIGTEYAKALVFEHGEGEGAVVTGVGRKRQGPDIIMTQMFTVFWDAVSIRSKNKVEQLGRFYKPIEIWWILFVPEDRWHPAATAPLDQTCKIRQAD